MVGIGWTIYLVKCNNDSLYAGITKNLELELQEINIFKKGRYFKKYSNLLPLKEVVYKEEGLPFKEAYAKITYLREMNRKRRDKFLITKKWPMGGRIKEYIKNKI